MGLFKKLFGQKSVINEQLIGVWLTDPKDKLTISTLGNVKMVFSEKGDLIYDIIEGDKTQRINMTFRTEGDILISDQPSHPKKERTKFEFENKDRLILEFSGEKAVF